MKAREVMTRDVTSILAETPLREAWRLMRELRVRHLPVVRGGKLVGMVSDRDFMGHASQSPGGGYTFADMTVGQVMSLEPVACVRGTPVSQIAREMVGRQIDCMPIVSEDRELLGLVTSTDLMTLLMETPEPVPFSFHVHPATRA